MNRMNRRLDTIKTATKDAREVVLRRVKAKIP